MPTSRPGRRVGTAYEPGCLSRCGNARFCRERAFQASLPCVSGTTTVRLIPNIGRLDRAAELTRGAAPTAAEAPAAAPAGSTTPPPTRRPA